MPFTLSGLITKSALALGAGALFVFVLLKLVTTIEGFGYDRAAAELALNYEVKARELKTELEAKAQARLDAIEVRRARANSVALEASKRTEEALQKLMETDNDFARCEAQRLPDSIRRHFPGGVLRETIAADHTDG